MNNFGEPIQDVSRHSTMRYIIPILFVAVTVLVGCHSPSVVHTQTPAPTVAAPPPFHPMLITTLGTNTSSDGRWRIGVSEASMDFTHTPAAHGGGWTTVSLDSLHGWRIQAGWFVFTESESRVWAYDGDRLLPLCTVTPDSSNGTTYFSPRFPCVVPTEVFSRLSEPAQKAIQTHE